MSTTVGVPTVRGDGNTPVTLWAGGSSSTLPDAYFTKLTVFGSMDSVRGFIFVVDPATLHPDLPRSTNYPSVA